MRHQVYVKVLLAFLAGIFLVLSVIYYSEWSYEKSMLSFMSKHIKEHCNEHDTTALIKTAFAYADQIVDPMVHIFGNDRFQSTKSFFVSPSFYVYYFGNGACGGYSIFMARLLTKMGFNVRFVEQRTYNKWGAHITLGIVSGNKLLLTDPLFKTVFIDSLGKMVDINTVAQNWGHYRQQTPAGYNPHYDYQSGWRYTNWDRLGLISRGMHRLLSGFIGKQQADDFSLRTYFLSTSKMYLYLSVFAFMVVSVIFIKLQYGRLSWRKHASSKTLHSAL